MKPTTTHCSECGEPQFGTPSGLTCKNGHGGSDSNPPKKSSKQKPNPARPVWDTDEAVEVKVWQYELSKLFHALTELIETFTEKIKERG